MDRTMFDRTGIILDRTILDIRRAEEKELSEVIHNKLEALTLIHKPTNEFKGILTKDMFLKPNPKGCLHVMHFLLSFYMEPEEFKKKFFWPIVDKKNESLFRSSVVNYLTELNEKHNLKWTHLKNYLISVPGGIKFITFVNELIDFIVSEIKKKRESEISELPEYKAIKDKKITNSILSETVREIDIFEKCAKEYEEQIDASRKRIQQNSQLLCTKLNEISLDTGIDVKILTDRNLWQEFRLSNRELFKELIIDKTKIINDCKKSLLDFKNSIDSLHQESGRKLFDRDQLIDSFKELQLSYPELRNENILKNNELDFEILISSLNIILSSEINDPIHHTIENHNEGSFEVEEIELKNIIQDIESLKNEIKEFESSLNSKKDKNDDNKKVDAHATPGINNTKTPSKLLLGDSNLENLYINTPPISVLTNLNSNKQRLPLLKDPQLNNSLMKSEVDKMSSYVQQLNLNSLKWNESVMKSHKKNKHRQYHHKFHQQPSSTSKLKLSSISGGSLLQRHRMFQKESKLSIENTPKLSRFTNKNDLHEISTSPSGRLDPIISGSQTSAAATASSSSSTLKVVAAAIAPSILDNEKSEMKISVEEKLSFVLEQSTDNLFSKSTLEVTEINRETIKIPSITTNDDGIISKDENEDENKTIKAQSKNEDCNLFNVSDSVLNDVSY